MLIEERNDHTDSVEVCVVEFGPTARVSDIRYGSLHRYQVAGVATEPVRPEQVLVLVGLLLGDVESLALLPRSVVKPPRLQVILLSLEVDGNAVIVLRGGVLQ